LNNQFDVMFSNSYFLTLRTKLNWLILTRGIYQKRI
jgi:hypothetical protein